MWVYNPKPAKLKQHEKAKLLEFVSEFVKNSTKLSGVISRFDIKAGRLYLYHLVEKYGWDDPKVQFTIELIDGKYQEFYLARIMIIDVKGEKCRLDWQRHNGQWMDLKEGTLEECLKFIENDEWFSNFI
ncbi:MAG: hypothetical protein ABF289_06370 [Clostridiales bacterium]